MKKALSLVLIAISLLVLVGGASILYNKLTKDYNPQSNLVLNGEGSTPTPDKYSQSSEDDGDTEDNNSSGDNTDSDNGYNDYYNFTVTDVDGKEVSLSDMAGKPVILNFWASWCPPCKMELPDFESAYLEYGDDIIFMMINLTDGNRETVEKATDFIKEEGYTFPVYFDTKSDVAYSFNVSSIPATYLVDEQGNVVGQAIGMLDKATLQDAIDYLTK